MISKWSESPSVDLDHAEVSNLFRPSATEGEYSGGDGHIANFSLCWGGGATASVFSNYFIPKLYESLHNQMPIVTIIYIL